MQLSVAVVLVLGLAAACVDVANAQASCAIGGPYPGGHPGGNRLAANVAAGPGVVANALNAKRAYANSWLHGIVVAAGVPGAAALRARPVSDLLMMGSHDAGTGETEVTDIPTLRSNGWYITQTYTIADQLCLGTRFFDLRFKWHTPSGQFRINHNDGYFRPANWIFADISTFLADHQHEILFLRFKVVGGTSVQTAAFWNALHVAIGAHAEVHAVGGAGAAENVGARTLGSIWAPAAPPGAPDHAGGRVFIMRYECEVRNPPAAAAACAGADFGGAGAQNTHFDIGHSIWGRYSDSNDRDEIALKQWNNAPLGITDQQFIEDTHPGQLQKWRRWNAHVPVAGPKPMFAFWWTSTGAFGRTLNAKDNTKALYEDKDSKLITTGKGVGTLTRGRDPMFGLHRLYHAANDVACDAGSFVVVDFIGDSVVQKTKHLSVAPNMHNPPDLVFNFLNHVNALRIANPKVGGVWPPAVCAESYSTMLIRNIHNYNFKQIHADAQTDAQTDADEDVQGVEDAEDADAEQDVDEDVDEDVDQDVDEDADAADEFEAEEEAEAEAEEVDA